MTPHTVAIHQSMAVSLLREMVDIISTSVSRRSKDVFIDAITR